MVTQSKIDEPAKLASYDNEQLILPGVSFTRFSNGIILLVQTHTAWAIPVARASSNFRTLRESKVKKKRAREEAGKGLNFKCIRTSSCLLIVPVVILVLWPKQIARSE